MPNFTGFFEDIKRNYESLENSLKTITTAYQKTILFFDSFFTWVPPEVILLFVFSVFLLILINNLSPSTPRANLTLSTILLCILWGYLNNAITGEIKFLWIAKTGLYILIPVYFFSIIGFALQKSIEAYKKRNRITASSADEYISKLERAYHNAMALSHQVAAGESGADELKNRLDMLIQVSENFKSFLK